MNYAKTYIAKKVYEKGTAKSGAYTYLSSVWFMVGELAHSLSRETYDNTWAAKVMHPDYQKSFGDLSDKELIEAFEFRMDSEIYQEYIEMEDLELFGNEAPLLKGSEYCMTSDAWILELNINELKSAA
jgi:hypothetical protein